MRLTAIVATGLVLLSAVPALAVQRVPLLEEFVGTG
jgi:hypothetical protein